MLGLLTSRWTLALALVAVIAVSVAVVSRNWKPQPKPEIERLGPYEIVAVDTGVVLTVKVTRWKTQTVVLDNIACPLPGEPFGKESNDSLTRISGGMGGKIWIEEAKGRRFTRPELCGEVFSEGDTNLNLAQLRAGWAVAHLDAPKAYHAAEKEARKTKRGMWAKITPKEPEL